MDRMGTRDPDGEHDPTALAAVLLFALMSVAALLVGVAKLAGA